MCVTNEQPERVNINPLAQEVDFSRNTNFETTDRIVNDRMATPIPCLAQLSRMCLPVGRQSISRTPVRLLAPTIQVRYKSRGANAPPIQSKAAKALKAASSNPQKNKKKDSEKKKKRKPRTTYRQYDMKDAEQFALCDAIRCVISLYPKDELY